MSKIKGQNLRVYMGSLSNAMKCIACATSCSVHIAANLEDSSTKDDTGDWQSQECVGRSWDMSVDALYVLSDTGGMIPFEIAKLIGQEVYVKFSETEDGSDQNRTETDAILSGKAIISDISITAANKQNASYTVQFQGTGELTFEEGEA